MSHASDRLIAKAPASTKARIVTSTQRGPHGTVAAPRSFRPRKRKPPSLSLPEARQTDSAFAATPSASKRV